MATPARMQRFKAVGKPAGSPHRVPGRNFAAWIGTAGVVVATAVVLVLCIGPRFLPYRVYTIVSGSMAPTIPVGSVAIVRPVEASALGPGDVISFHRPDASRELVTHRIVAVQHTAHGRVFVTKGDANSVPDPWRVPDRGVGQRYVFAVPYLGYVLSALQAPLLRLLLVSLVALVAVAVSLRRIWRPTARAASTS